MIFEINQKLGDNLICYGTLCSINTIRGREGTLLHHFLVRTTNDVTTYHYLFRPHIFRPSVALCIRIVAYQKKAFV